jgi:hypothetical protein
MQTRVTLRVLNVDLDDDETVECVAEHLGDLAWSVVDGVTSVTLFAETANVVSQAIETAHRIEHKLVGSRVAEVDDELVAIPDISARTKVHRETVRSWVNGTRGPGDFPLPKSSFGGGDRGSMKAWRWADVNEWLGKHYALGDGYLYPTRKEYAEINAFLARAEYMLTLAMPNVSQPNISVTQVQYLQQKEAPFLTTGATGAGGLQATSNNLLVEASREM